MDIIKTMTWLLYLRQVRVGEVYEIQGLKIALPLAEDSYKLSDNKLEQRWKQLRSA